MGLPGWGNVAGIASSIVYRLLDPRRKEEKLIEEKKKLYKLPDTDKRARRVAWIDNELVRVRRDISRRAG